MTIIEAAIQVLTDAGGGPLQTKELTKRMLDAGLWTTNRQKPEASVRSAINRDINQNGEKSAFVKTRRGHFALRNNNAAGGEAPRLSFTDCAYRVLKEMGDRKPMYYRDITEKASEKGWLASEGKTPEATMLASISGEIKRNNRQGKTPRFINHGGGMVGLGEWAGRGILLEVNRHNEKVRKELHKRLLAMNPRRFEELITVLVVEMGFTDVELTPLNRDGGIDVKGTLMAGEVMPIKVAIQVKRWNRNVQAPDVQKMRGALSIGEKGVIINTKDFAKGAKSEAQREGAEPIRLINGQRLVLLLMQYRIGVSRETPNLFEIDEDVFRQNRNNAANGKGGAGQ